MFPFSCEVVSVMLFAFVYQKTSSGKGMRCPVSTVRGSSRAQSLNGSPENLDSLYPNISSLFHIFGSRAGSKVAWSPFRALGPVWLFLDLLAAAPHALFIFPSSSSSGFPALAVDFITYPASYTDVPRPRDWTQQTFNTTSRNQTHQFYPSPSV